MGEQDIRQFMEEMNRQQAAEKVERYRRLNRFAKPGQVVLAGSSLMEQLPFHELAQGEELPLHVYNRGIGGFVTSQLLEVLDVCVYDLRPSHVFLNIGTNDMNGPEYRLGDMLARYERIVKEIQGHLPGARLHLLAYYPVNPDVAPPFMAGVLQWRTNQVLEEANRAVREMAARTGCAFLDCNEGLRDGQGRLKAAYTVEGMHMYADGYRVVLDSLLPILRALPANTAQPFASQEGMA